MKAVNGNGSSLTSGQLADLAGVSRDTLRHYERKGVLTRPLRGHNGYRPYPSEALQRVQLVRRALSVGFTLDELARVLKVRDAGGAPCEEVRRIASQKLVDVQEQLRELTSLRDDLQKILREWNARLAERSEGKRANLLESLSNGSNRAGRSRPSIKRKKEK
jgi:DNA-binding transcriptional MerR regulator